MKKYAFIILFTVSCIVSIAQKPLRKNTIMDFAAVCWFNYRYGNDMFIATMNTYMGYPSLSQVATAMEHLDKDKEARDRALQVVYRISSGIRESIFRQLYSLKLDADECNELADYIIARNKEQSRNTEVKRNPYPYFQGTKRFEDGYKTYMREVIIQGNIITIKVYPSEFNNSYPDKNKVLGTETGYIKDGKVYIKEGDKYTSDSYKVEGENLIVLYGQGD